MVGKLKIVVLNIYDAVDISQLSEIGSLFLCIFFDKKCAAF